MFPVFWMVIVSAEYDPAGIGFGVKNLLRLTPGVLVNVALAGCGFVAPQQWLQPELGFHS